MEEKKKKSKVPMILAVVALTLVMLAAVFYFVFPQYAGLSPAKTGGVVLSIDDYDVMADEYLYRVMDAKKYYEATNPGYFAENRDKEAEVFDELNRMFAGYYSRLALANDKGIKLTDEDKKEILDYVEETKKINGGEENYQKLLGDMYLTEDLYIRLTQTELILSKLGKQFYDEGDMSNVSDQEIADYAKERGFVGAKHILILRGETEAEDAEKKELAESILKKLRSGANFDELSAKYNEDPGMIDTPEGYTFAFGEVEEEFYNGALALKVGEISEIVESKTLGYHIIMRTETNKELIKNNIIMNNIDALFEEYASNAKISLGRGYHWMRMSDFAWTGPTGGVGAKAEDNASGDKAPDSDK
ncbi:MAG: peptidylprolyl isomerase [Oscillospiraceae bacterium]